MACRVNAESLKLWLIGKEFTERDASFFNTLEKDNVFNNGMNHNEYKDLRRNEKILLSILRYKRYIEYGIQNGLRWTDGNTNVINAANITVSIAFLYSLLILVVTKGHTYLTNLQVLAAGFFKYVWRFVPTKY